MSQRAHSSLTPLLGSWQYLTRYGGRGFQEAKRKHFCGRMWEPKDSDCFLENLRGFWTINHQASSFIRLLNLSQGRKLWGIWPHNCWQHCFVGLDQLNILFNLFFFFFFASCLSNTKESCKVCAFLSHPPSSPSCRLLPPSIRPSIPPSPAPCWTKTTALCWLSAILGVRISLFTDAGGRDAAAWVAVGGVEV